MLRFRAYVSENYCILVEPVCCANTVCGHHTLYAPNNACI